MLGDLRVARAAFLGSRGRGPGDSRASSVVIATAVEARRCVPRRASTARPVSEYRVPPGLGESFAGLEPFVRGSIRCSTHGCRRGSASSQSGMGPCPSRAATAHYDLATECRRPHGCCQQPLGLLHGSPLSCRCCPVHRHQKMKHQVTCTPLRIPRDLSQRDFIRLETESKRWLSYKGAKLWVCARVLYRKLGQRGAPKVTLSGLVLFPVGRLRQERVMG